MWLFKKIFNLKQAIIKELISLVSITIFLTVLILPLDAKNLSIDQPALLNLPDPGTMLSLSEGYVPTIIRGLTVYPEDPLRFGFIIDKGEAMLEGNELTKESNKLIRYFFATITIPEDEQWVNLSPYEKGRIIPDSLGITEMGRDLLRQDYILKQMTASLIYPKNDLGENFWNRVYAKAQRLYGTTDIVVNTFNKVWIIPDKATVFEQGNSVFVVENRLKVMLEEDYLSLQSNLNKKNLSTNEKDNRDSESMGEFSSKIVSEIAKKVLIPELEKEINEGKNFATLRQIYNSMLLATWYKYTLKQSILGKIYANQNKIKGIHLNDKAIKTKIYDQYIKAFEQGVYNFVKEDYDPFTQTIIPRKYFSGGTVSYRKRENGEMPYTVISEDTGYSSIQILNQKEKIREQQTKLVIADAKVLEFSENNLARISQDERLNARDQAVASETAETELWGNAGIVEKKLFDQSEIFEKALNEIGLNDAGKIIDFEKLQNMDKEPIDEVRLKKIRAESGVIDAQMIFGTIALVYNSEIEIPRSIFLHHQRGNAGVHSSKDGLNAIDIEGIVGNNPPKQNSVLVHELRHQLVNINDKKRADLTGKSIARTNPDTDPLFSPQAAYLNELHSQFFDRVNAPIKLRGMAHTIFKRIENPMYSTLKKGSHLTLVEATPEVQDDTKHLFSILQKVIALSDFSRTIEGGNGSFELRENEFENSLGKVQSLIDAIVKDLNLEPKKFHTMKAAIQWLNHSKELLMILQKFLNEYSLILEDDVEKILTDIFPNQDFFFDIPILSDEQLDHLAGHPRKAELIKNLLTLIYSHKVPQTRINPKIDDLVYKVGTTLGVVTSVKDARKLVEHYWNEFMESNLELVEIVAKLPDFHSILSQDFERKKNSPPSSPFSVKPTNPMRMTTLPGRLAHSEEMIQHLAEKKFPNNGKGQTVYDIGIGWAEHEGPITLRELAKALPKARIIGLDNQIPKYIIRAKKEGQTRMHDLLLIKGEDEIITYMSGMRSRSSEEMDDELKNQLIDLLESLRNEQEPVVGRRLEDGLEYELIAHPIKKFADDNLSFVDADLFDLKRNPKMQNIPKANIVRIMNLLGIYYGREYIKIALEQLLPFVLEGGYVIIGHTDAHGEPIEEAVIYRKEGNKFIADRYAFSMDVSPYSDITQIVMGKSSYGLISPAVKMAYEFYSLIRAQPEYKTWKDIAQRHSLLSDSDKQSKEFRNSLDQVRNVFVKELKAKGLNAEKLGNMISVGVTSHGNKVDSVALELFELIEHNIFDAGFPKEISESLQDVQFSDVGGIDLNPENFDLLIKRDGHGIALPLTHQSLKNVNIEGFIPIIINISPANFSVMFSSE